MGEHRHRLTPGLNIDLLGELSVNEWKGARRIQLVFQDWKTDELLIHDRRSEKGMWLALEKLVLNRKEGCMIGCASPGIYEVALSRFSHTEVPIYLLAAARAKEAAVLETAAGDQQLTAQFNGWRELFLIGLPDNEQDVLA
jgi:single-stranded-DNA-specific exonuclease